MKTSDFNFDLPPECIAQTAIEPRDHARLLQVNYNKFVDYHFYDLPNILHRGDLLVMNNTRVIPARLFGLCRSIKVEILLHKKKSDGTWLAFARPGKKIRRGDVIHFATDFLANIIEKLSDGQVLIKFDVSEDIFSALLAQYGEPPLPPYIKRGLGKAKDDRDRYQTVYATREGAVAAPTAGLHFTPQLLNKLKSVGIEQTFVTLHVGAGTFLPVKADYIKDHVMHTEWGEISSATATTINRARDEGRRIVAVGTTSLRILESAADTTGFVHSFTGDTSIFITPGYSFRTIDALLTNFHLPQSTLFMLVSAFMGLETMHKAYTHAIKNDYRFYSFGDACLLERRPHVSLG